MTYTFLKRKFQTVILINATKTNNNDNTNREMRLGVTDGVRWAESWHFVVRVLGKPLYGGNT